MAGEEGSQPGVASDAPDGLTELWLARWPDSRPLGPDLRHCFPDRWVRLHSLPESRRYAETDNDYTELLHRHHTVLDELRGNSCADDDGNEHRVHLFVSRVRSGAAAFDQLLRLVADNVTADVVVSDTGLNWLYHPYDGGADVIAGSIAQRDDLRAAHPTWLSARPSGL